MIYMDIFYVLLIQIDYKIASSTAHDQQVDLLVVELLDSH